MLVLVPSATHIWERVIPGGGVHCHWKEPSLATVQERLAADTTLSGPGGTAGSTEDCRNVIEVVGRATNERRKLYITNTILLENLACIKFGDFSQNAVFLNLVKLIYGNLNQKMT